MAQNSTVLIVDDQKLGREALQVTLEAEGYQLAFASNGPEALDAAASLRPDLVLLDVMMPDMDGFEVCRRLRATPETAEIPIVLVTALDDRQSRIRGIEAGADDFVSKPFDRVELRARVRTITRLNRYRRLLLERARFEWVVEHAGDGYLVVNGDDQILYANERARLYLDLASDRPGEPGITLTAAAARHYRLEPYEDWELNARAAACERRSPLFLVRPESPTSNAMWLQADVLALGTPVEDGWLLRLTDVTSRIAMQRDMRTFHTLITHKLRTPLSHILGSLQMVEEYLEMSSGGDSDSTLPELVQVALGGATRLHTEIQDVLRYIHVPALAGLGSSFPLARLPGVIHAIAVELDIEDVDAQVAEEAAGCLLALSSEAVELIGRELLENSLKFHPQQEPAISVMARIAEGGRALIRFQDDGIHLSPEQMARLWQPYQQGEKDFTGEMAGMGLGLATVTSLVWEVGGRCRLFNRPDSPGIVIELDLPLSRCED